MQAAIGCAQIKKFQPLLNRKYNFARLRAALEPIADKLILPVACENSDPSWFGFLMTCKKGVERKKLFPILKTRRSDKNAFAGNLTKHPCFDQMRASGKGFRIVGDLTNTDIIMNDTFWVGVYPGMTDEKIDYMTKVIIEAVNQ